MEQVVTIEEFARKRARRNSSIKKNLVIILFLLPFLAAFIVFFVYPLFYGIYISLTNFTYSSPGTETLNDFRWYRMIFFGGDRVSYQLIQESFWRAFMHSFIFSIIMVPLAIGVPLLLAYLVKLHPPGFKLFRALIYMPSIIPLTASGAIFTMIFLPANQHGLLAEFFSDIEWPMWFSQTWFSFNIGDFEIDVVYTWIPIFLMCFWGGWGGNFIILSAGLENVPLNLYQAASMDGCGRAKQMKYVTLPGIKGQLILCLFTTIIGYLGLYGQNYVLGGASFTHLSALPGAMKTSTAIYFIQDIVANNANFKESLYGLGAAASVVYAILVGIISGIQQFITRDKKGGNKHSKEYARWLKQGQ